MFGITLGNLQIANNGHTVTLMAQNGGVSSSTAILLITLANLLNPEDRLSGDVKKLNAHVAQITYNYGTAKGALELTVHWDSESHPALDFYSFYWKKPAQIKSLQDSINLDANSENGAFWYGGINLRDLEWPMNKANDIYPMNPFILNDIYQYTNTSGQERYWLSSKKVALTVPWNVPLWTAVKNGQLQLQSQMSDSPFLLVNDHLEYTLSVPKDPKMTLKDFHQHCFKKFLKAPTAYPDLSIMAKPIWSTWANFWTDVDQKGIEEYAKEIHNRGFPISQLELDDKWTTKYGDYEIDTKKFHNFSGMVQRIKQEFGVPRLTAWVHPFVNADSENGKNMELRNKLFIKSKNGDVPLSWWWDCPVKLEDPTKPVGPDNKDIQQPCAYVLDLTNPEAREWWRTELKKMQAEGIYTFKFDAGETNWFPKDYTLYSGDIPNSFGKDYAYFAAEFGPAVENRYGSGSQQANIFMRTMDRNSLWDENGGLFTLIPWALQSSLQGYFWNLPDMIGGNGLNHTEKNIKGVPPEPELYIRWTQVNAFLLAMQFSYPPWHPSYGPDVEKAVKEVLAIREKWIPYILDNVKSAVKNQEPVIRPMWWESDDLAALSCKDQYMVGTDLVVAPVIKKGETKRNVFLPTGSWKDGNNEKAPAIKGPTTVRDYDAPLNVLPFFYREKGSQPAGNGAIGDEAKNGILLGMLSLLGLAALAIF